MKSEILRANIKVHTLMADTYNQNEPHFRPENRAKVRNNLKALCNNSTGVLLDVGCGTGFIIDLAKDLFGEIHGVDITQAMLDKVDTSSGNITLHDTPAERLPFPDGYFDVVTAYSFLHHLEDYAVVLKEAYRVMKPKAVLYVDLEPNKLFWQAIVNLESSTPDARDLLSDIVKREIESVLHTDERVEQEFGIERKVFNLAEYTKSILGGIDPYAFSASVKEIGFSNCEISFEWFLGQGNVMHGQSFEAATTIETYLKRLIPLSSHLFKYLKFVARK